MAAPGRIYVGVFVFALIATLTIVPVTVLILSGYSPPPALPLAPTKEYSLGEKVAFSLASVTCVLLTLASWRLLMEGARKRRALREERRHSRAAVEVGGDGGPARPVEDHGEDPPGYG